MMDIEFKQKLAIALAGNPEFVKYSDSSQSNKRVGFCISAEINYAIKNIEIENKQKGEK